MKHPILIFFIILFVSFASYAHAEERSKKKRTDRKGFIFGFNLGGGGVSSRGDHGGAYMSSYKVGGGINERILLFGEGFGRIGIGREVIVDGNQNGLPAFIGSYFSAQFFVYRDFYVRPKLGVAFLIGEYLNNQALQAFGIQQSTKLGPAVGLSAGHEWRFLKRFALSPELSADYIRLRGGNHFFYGGMLDLRWYF